MNQGTFQAGISRAVITPPMSAPHASWGAQLHVLPDGVAIDLYATVLVVDDGNERAAFCELEVVIVSGEESDAIRAAVGRELGIDPAHVRVSISHNHAGPPPSAWNWTKLGQDALDNYFKLLPSMVEGAARAARFAMRPARVGWGRGESHVAFNRRETSPTGRTVTGVNLNGAIDPEVLVLRIDGLDGEPIGSIGGYTMHPTFLGPSNRVISSDWPGQMRKVVEQVTGAPMLFAQGATGDIGPGPKGFSNDLRALHAVGGQVGCEAARVYLSIDLPAVRYEHDRVQESGAPLSLWKAIPLEEEAPVVRARSVTIELPLAEQMTIDEAEGRVAAAQELLDELKAAGAPSSEIEAATFVTKRANMTLFRSTSYYGKTSAKVELHLLQIGPVVFAGVEGEPFSETGKRIKAESPFPATWFGGYTGGWAGYVPTPEELPRKGYEVDTSPFAENAATVLADQVIAALNALANE
ncbi:hypothetical protein BH09CHL1_BH09CHL1_01810 [soil metagenome]